MSTTASASRSGGATFLATWRRILETWNGRIGLALILLVALVVVIGPLVAPHATTETVGLPFEGPSTDRPLGTDFLGRDALSRFLSGGASILLVSALAMLLAYLVGTTIGMIAAYKRSWTDLAFVGATDVLLSFPPIVFVLVLLAYVGPKTWLVVVGLAITQAPRVARVSRAATLDLVGMEYIEAAYSRGETTLAIIRREVLPNIASPLLVDVGVRFTATIILAASISFLGLGPQPPAADWGLMISENRSGITAAPLLILAPTIALAVLTIGVNLVVDAFARTVGRSVPVRDA